MIEDTFWKDKKVLITGHTGFKGTWLIIWLNMMGAKIYGYSLPPLSSCLFTSISEKLREKISHYESNILNFSSLKNCIEESQPDVIFHLAAQSLVIKSYQEPIKTWQTNVIGSLNILECAKSIKKECAIIIVTTDKVYENKEWSFGYRENDTLGGHDPYSASKAATEMAVNSWRLCFSSKKRDNKSNLYIATARSGNVIGGGDWAENRLIPDIIRALKIKEKFIIRNPYSTRPWQHVLEPLFGYLLLAENLLKSPNNYCEPFNFGPDLNSNRTVEEVVKNVLQHWHGEWEIKKKYEEFHEANLLHLQSEKANKFLNWRTKWDFDRTIYETISWYRDTHNGKDEFIKCQENINSFTENS